MNASTTRTLVLWDVDGTLLEGETADIWQDTLFEVGGPEVVVGALRSWSGKTDLLIAREALTGAGLAGDRFDTALTAFAPAYTRRYAEIQAIMHQRFTVLPGVVEVLAALRERGVAQTLLTGNLEPVAALKMTALGLAPYLDLELGGYGSDHEDRACLVGIARAKAERGLRVGDVVVVGDTPLDIACARAGGARMVSVATGAFTVDELREHSPDLLLPNLRDTEGVCAAILGASDALGAS